MSNAVVDVIAPSFLIVPSLSGVAITTSGALYLSGAKLYVSLGGQGRLITSAA